MGKGGDDPGRFDNVNRATYGRNNQSCVKKITFIEFEGFDILC
jgi:hypothetical protein